MIDQIVRNQRIKHMGILLIRDGYFVYTKKKSRALNKYEQNSKKIARTPEQILDLIGVVKKRILNDKKWELIIYEKIKAPIPFMSGRDLIMVQRVYKQNDGIITFCCKPNLSSKKTLLIPKIERTEMHLSGWIIVPQKNQMTKIIAIQFLILKEMYLNQ
ncbi:unnamed protein product [Paramecium octaurelia]|uniref:Uncharacterized protein n=1 Tax=Paramecium octaurelia TaxID=43137 RepID=A0A8S1X1P0_PAROT|nr:unnamed protein product [Paramecium octaurelia]